MSIFLHKAIFPILLSILFTGVYTTSNAATLKPSGTIPVLSIETEDSRPIVDKETKIPAVMSVAIPEGYETLNYLEAENLENITLTIKGRGNSSWNLDKKPYKLKLDKKTALLGMPRHKHFALIAYPGTYDGYAGVGGMELARATGQPWAPLIEPVELMINGSYEGRYYLVESIKIDPNRVNIWEQPEENSDAETVDGGWLVEIDNYDDEFQIKVEEPGTPYMRITHKSPEVLSDLQRQWLTDQFNAIVKAAYDETDRDGSGWAKLIDPNSLARYFLVREILHDTDGYNGSFYFHKDLGEDTRWIAGPMWDFTITEKSDWVKDDHPAYHAIRLINPIMKTYIFRSAVVEEWDKLTPKLEDVYDHIRRLGKICTEANKHNAERWPQYEGGGDYSDGAISILRDNAAWMEEQIRIFAGLPGTPSADSAPIVRVCGDYIEVSGAVETATIEIFNIAGVPVLVAEVDGGGRIAIGTHAPGIYTIRATSPGTIPTTLKAIL